MNLRIVHLVVATLALACSLSCGAQERGYWQAASNTAASITGDISISESKITIDFKAFPLASIRSLKPAEVAAVFDADANTARPGALYRLKIPAEQRFLHKSALCGEQDTQWMAAYVVGKTLQVAFFSGDDAPEFTFDAIAHSSNLCGTYTYVR
ncbi:MAG: hypothetical protein WBQ94_01620 [Terracidiphilus sp.]